jgi:uncharacterized protein (DUF2345 family)
MKKLNVTPEIPSTQALELASGRSVACRPVEESCDEVTIRGPAGEVLLEVLLTPAGPVLRFRAAQVELDCEGSFKVRCQDFEVEAGGQVHVASDEMRLEARRGDLNVRANDDVNLNGERVRLNC